MCSAIFTTIEQTDLTAAVMVQRAAHLEPFVRDKLFVSIYEACKHRSKALEDSLELTQTIISDIMKQVSPEGVIGHEYITELAHTVLGRFDPVAATVYLAYHK